MADTRTPELPLKRHERFPEWMVDTAGNVWKQTREFGCPNHPFGPPREDRDDLEDSGAVYAACAKIVLYLLDEMQTEAVLTVAPGTTRELVDEARIELGLCCHGKRWRNTGWSEVGPYEMFVMSHRDIVFANMRESIDDGVLFGMLNNTWQGTDEPIRIPLILGKPLPKTDAALEAERDKHG